MAGMLSDSRHVASAGSNCGLQRLCSSLIHQSSRSPVQQSASCTRTMLTHLQLLTFQIARSALTRR